MFETYIHKKVIEYQILSEFLNAIYDCSIRKV